MFPQYYHKAYCAYMSILQGTDYWYIFADAQDDWNYYIINIVDDVWIVSKKKEDSLRDSADNGIQVFDKINGEWTELYSKYNVDVTNKNFPDYYHNMYHNYMYLNNNNDKWFIDPPNQQDWVTVIEYNNIWIVKSYKEDTCESLVRLYDFNNNQWQKIFEKMS